MKVTSKGVDPVATEATSIEPSDQQNRKRSSSDAELNDDDSASFLDDLLVDVLDDDLSPTDPPESDPPELNEGGEKKEPIATKEDDPPELIEGGQSKEHMSIQEDMVKEEVDGFVLLLLPKTF